MGGENVKEKKGAIPPAGGAKEAKKWNEFLNFRKDFQKLIITNS